MKEDKCNALIHASGLWCANPKIGCPLHDPIARKKALDDFNEKLHKKSPAEIEELELRAYKRGYEAMIVDAKEAIQKHFKSNTYEAEESLVFQTTLKEVLQILDTLKA